MLVTSLNFLWYNAANSAQRYLWFAASTFIAMGTGESREPRYGSAVSILQATADSLTA